jgi:hypothetical protein
MHPRSAKYKGASRRLFSTTDDIWQWQVLVLLRAATVDVTVADFSTEGTYARLAAVGVRHSTRLVARGLSLVVGCDMMAVRLKGREGEQKLFDSDRAVHSEGPPRSRLEVLGPITVVRRDRLVDP